jgi:glycosyltransferase involved in cell wall biosynthesis
MTTLEKRRLMRLLFAIGDTYLPENIGGGTLGIHDAALELLRYGHGCEVIASSSPSVRQIACRILRRASGRRWNGGTIHVQQNGYVTHRAIHASAVPHLLKKRLFAFRPDVVVAQGENFVELAVEAITLGYPVVVRLNTAESATRLKECINQNTKVEAIVKPPHAVITSNSQFIATRVRELLGLESPVIYPLIRFNDLKVRERHREFITFVNPCKLKGFDIAIKIAALLPHHKFLFVESWPLSRAARQQLNHQLKTVPNVEFRPRSLRMREVYQRTSILLMPSQWEEAFGRVIVEAALNGIPAVASRIGGIPEALGNGGVLLSPGEPAESWAETLDRMLLDENLYGRLSANAALSAARPELNPDEIIQQFLKIARSVTRPCSYSQARDRCLSGTYATRLEP